MESNHHNLKGMSRSPCHLSVCLSSFRFLRLRVFKLVSRPSPALTRSSDINTLEGGVTCLRCVTELHVIFGLPIPLSFDSTKVMYNV